MVAVRRARCRAEMPLGVPLAGGRWSSAPTAQRPDHPFALASPLAGRQSVATPYVRCGGGFGEAATVKAFMLPTRRDRWVALLANPSRRKKATLRLAHNPDLDPRYIQRIPGEDQDAPKILAQLQAQGAPPMCHLISEKADLDGRDLALAEALDEVVGSTYGTLVICVPGKLGYYEGEDQGERYILHRKA